MIPPQGVGVAGGIARSQLEYPTVDVTLAYLAAINKLQYAGSNVLAGNAKFTFIVTADSFTDKAILSYSCGLHDKGNLGRLQNYSNYYFDTLDPNIQTADHKLCKIIANTLTTLATEAVDIDAGGHSMMLSISGSTLKSFRDTTTTPQISATDTSLASGFFGVAPNPGGYNGYMSLTPVMLKAPASPSPPAQSIIEVNVEGSGKPDDPFRPSPSRNLAEITSLTGLPDFLYQEAKKYSILKAKGFTDEEIQLLFGYIPQHQVDLDAVTWGAFELHADKAPTAIITITGDNPYKSGAIQRQIDFARSKNLRVFSPPRDYREAVALYNQLERDYQHWLAGKDNFAYQTLGWEILDLMQNVDFYYGELLDHKTHYNQLKQVPDFEINNRLNELIDKLNRETALTDERDKHIGKAKEILKKGW
jgi:hypothetical protein